MIAASVLILCVAPCSLDGEAIHDLHKQALRSIQIFATQVEAISVQEKSSTVRDSDFDEILFFDRLHQTFLLLYQIAIPAYREHFRGEPDKLSVIQYYAERLAAVMKDEPTEAQLAVPVASDGSPAAIASARTAMRAALTALATGITESAEHHLNLVGAKPRVELSRSDESRGASTARCLLYDPELFWAHRRLRELKTSRALEMAPGSISQAMDDAHVAIRLLRGQPSERDLSLRKFLDKHRQAAWKLAWLYRCRGLELDDPIAARVCFLRAWTIGDALFPVAERGRIDRFDPVFLAELADVYARLERFDLMLRYIYCDEGLPARYELARPIAELARVAESIRLVRGDQTADVHGDQELPETVSQVLFDQPVIAQPNLHITELNRTFEAPRGMRFGWLLVGIGGCLMCAAIAWGIARGHADPKSS